MDSIAHVTINREIETLIFKASEVVFKRRNGDHPFRILGLYGAGRNIEVSCVQSKHNLSTTSLAHINSTTCYNVQVKGKYLRLIIVWSGFPDNNLFFFSLLFVPLCISWPRFFVTSNEVLLYCRCTAPYMRENDDQGDCFEHCKGRKRIVQWVLKLISYWVDQIDLKQQQSINNEHWACCSMVSHFATFVRWLKDS